MTTKQTVSNLENKKLEIERKIQSIQDTCKHPTTIIKFDKQNSVRIFCEECNKELGVASEQEVKKFLNNK